MFFSWCNNDIGRNLVVHSQALVMASLESAKLAEYNTYLKNSLKKYKNKHTTKREILEVLIGYTDLKPNFQPQTFNDDSRKDLLQLKGTIPVKYRGSTYNIPICMVLLETHPFEPPLCYIQPTNTMRINTGKHVDSSGRIHLPYLQEWKHPDCNLMGLIEVMRIKFAEEPPVLAKSPASSRLNKTTQSTIMAAGPSLQPQTINGRLTLDLSNQGLTSIPEEVFDMTDLEHLNVSNNKLTSIPEAIGRLQKLNSLDAQQNLLTSLPQAICSLSQLSRLIVSKNNISSLPPGIEHMQKLKILGLDHNDLTEIPQEIYSLSNLEELGVYNNKLSYLPPGIENLQQLTCLYITNNQLKELPSGVGKLKELRQLYINGNQLTELPLSVCSLSNLEILIMDKNYLSTLPPGLEKMQKLKKVSIRFNLLTEITAALISPALEELHICFNQITRLPTTLSQAHKLKCLNVMGNPLTYPPQNICAKGIGAIMTFLKKAVKDKRLHRAFSRLSLKVTQTQLKPLARSLGLDKEAMDAVKACADDLQDQVYLTLEKWKEKEGEAATLPELEECLRDLDLHQLADGLLGTPTSPENRTFESEEQGAFGGQEAIQPQSRYPSVTVDDKFPVIKFEQLDFPADCYLGHGGFAAVAKARHRDWKHDVAVKRLLARETEGSEQQILYSEARKLNLGSRSASIIGLLGVCLDPHFAIVMPYMENGSLAGLLRDVDVPWALRWRMAHEISLGMTFLHCQNPQILHCDLKAENVLLDEDFHVKISDFGLSKWRTKSRIVTATSPTGATITHAPPEYFMDINLVPTDKFDVYSFGVLLWEMITRRDPYENAMNSALIELGVRTGQRPDMRLVPTDVPDMDTVSQLMQKCWSQEQDDRPSFQECADELWGVKNKSSKENILEAIIYVQKEKFGKK